MFSVDASAAGVGDLEAVVTHRGHVVPTHCEPVADGRYRYTFKPRDIGHYDVTVTFNDEQIPGTLVCVVCGCGVWVCGGVGRVGCVVVWVGWCGWGVVCVCGVFVCVGWGGCVGRCVWWCG